MVSSLDLFLSVLQRILFSQNLQKDIFPSWSRNKLNFNENENYWLMESFKSSLSFYLNETKRQK